MTIRGVSRVLGVLFIAFPALTLSFSSDKVGTFLPETSQVILSLDNLSGGARRGFYFGDSNAHATPYTPFAGDFDGNGADSLGYYNPREGRFYLAQTNIPGVIQRVIDFAPVSAPSGTLWPVVEDWTGDGSADAGLFDDGNRTWYLSGMAPFQWGWADMRAIPLVGDWDGDGQPGIGLYNPQLGKFAFSNSVPPSGEATVLAYGPIGGVHPVVGDWDGDGRDSAGYYVLAESTFHLRNDVTGGDLKTVTIAETLPEFRYSENNRPGTFPLAGTWDLNPPLPADQLYGWTEDLPENNGLSSALLAEAVATAQGPGYGHLHSLLVARHGKLVEESYFRGYGKYTTNNIKSVSKSILSALYGVAIDKGDIQNADPLDPLPSLKNISMQSDYLFEYPFSPEITLYNMITMSAGLAWNENPFPVGFLSSTDWVGFVVTQEYDWRQRGTTFKYSSGLTHCGSEILTRATGIETKVFAEQNLFSRIGITATRWDHEPVTNVIPENSGRNLYMGGWQVQMRPRDLAGFGQLYLDDGVFDDGSGPVQVVPRVWIEQTTTSAGIVSYYGAWWRTETFCQAKPGGYCFSGFNALGYGGQHIFVFPSLDMVVVMTSTWNVSGSTSGAQINANRVLLSDVLDAVVGD